MTENKMSWLKYGAVALVIVLMVVGLVFFAGDSEESSTNTNRVVTNTVVTNTVVTNSNSNVNK